MFIRRKPWFKRKNGQITMWDIDWGSDTIYIAIEANPDMRKQSLDIALATFIAKKRMYNPNFKLDLTENAEYAELIKLIKRKRIR